MILETASFYLFQDSLPRHYLTAVAFSRSTS